MKKVKIRYIGLLPPPIGGVTIHNSRLFQWLQRTDDVSVKMTVLNNVEAEENDVEQVGNKFFWLLKRLLFGFKEDIIHYQASNIYGLFFLVLVKKIHKNFKLVWSIQGEHIVTIVKNSFFKGMIYNIDKIIVANQNIEDDLYSIGMKASNVTLISPFLMPLIEENPNLLSKYRQKNMKILIFNAYRLEITKNGDDIYGFKTLINSFNKVNADTILILLIPSMNREEKEYFQKELNKLALDKRARIIHIQDEKNYGWQYISQSDIFIRPTITDGDAVSVKEALCFKIPAVVSDCTYRPNEAIQFKTNDSDDLARVVNELIENYEFEKEKLKNIDFCSKSKGLDFINLYKEMVI